MVSSNSDIHADVVVLGSGPGGYTAAFRAADLGLKTVLIERYSQLGGVCLNVGCIPSKALLHTAKIISEADELKENGIIFGKPKIDIRKLRGSVNGVVGQLTVGLASMAKQRGVQIVHGHGQFKDFESINVIDENAVQRIVFRDAIIASGSQPASLPFLPNDPRIVDSTGALSLDKIPKRLLVIGGGIVGLELATVYYELGSSITVVEIEDSLITEADRDVVKPLITRISKKFENILLGTRVVSVDVENENLQVMFENSKERSLDSFDLILEAVGRTPNSHSIGARNAGVEVDERGFIPVDQRQKTNIEGIYAIGDVTGQPMLAHKATHQGKIAAEAITGMKSSFDVRTIPSVAYTDPEVAWAGLTEKEARRMGIECEKAVFPWRASGRALSMGRPEGITKLLFNKSSNLIVGAGICGPNAGELIAEVTLAIEMGADATDLALTIHAHPTLSETIGFAAEMYEGTITDLYIPRKNR